MAENLIEYVFKNTSSDIYKKYKLRIKSEIKIFNKNGVLLTTINPELGVIDNDKKYKPCTDKAYWTVIGSTSNPVFYDKTSGIFEPDGSNASNIIYDSKKALNITIDIDDEKNKNYLVEGNKIVAEITVELHLSDPNRSEVVDDNNPEYGLYTVELKPEEDGEKPNATLHESYFKHFRPDVYLVTTPTKLVTQIPSNLSGSVANGTSDCIIKHEYSLDNYNDDAIINNLPIIYSTKEGVELVAFTDYSNAKTSSEDTIETQADDDNENSVEDTTNSNSDTSLKIQSLVFSLSEEIIGNTGKIWDKIIQSNSAAVVNLKCIKTKFDLYKDQVTLTNSINENITLPLFFKFNIHRTTPKIWLISYLKKGINANNKPTFIDNDNVPPVISPAIYFYDSNKDYKEQILKDPDTYSTEENISMEEITKIQFPETAHKYDDNYDTTNKLIERNTEALYYDINQKIYIPKFYSYTESATDMSTGYYNVIPKSFKLVALGLTKSSYSKDGIRNMLYGDARYSPQGKEIYWFENFATTKDSDEDDFCFTFSDILCNTNETFYIDMSSVDSNQYSRFEYYRTHLLAVYTNNFVSVTLDIKTLISEKDKFYLEQNNNVLNEKCQGGAVCIYIGGVDENGTFVSYKDEDRESFIRLGRNILCVNAAYKEKLKTNKNAIKGVYNLQVLSTEEKTDFIEKVQFDIRLGTYLMLAHDKSDTQNKRKGVYTNINNIDNNVYDITDTSNPFNTENYILGCTTCISMSKDTGDTVDAYNHIKYNFYNWTYKDFEQTLYWGNGSQTQGILSKTVNYIPTYNK